MSAASVIGSVLRRADLHHTVAKDTSKRPVARGYKPVRLMIPGDPPDNRHHWSGFFVRPVGQTPDELAESGPKVLAALAAAGAVPVARDGSDLPSDPSKDTKAQAAERRYRCYRLGSSGGGAGSADTPAGF